MEEIFTYGTLQDPKVQMKIIGRTIKGIPDGLAGYKKSTITIGNILYPIIIPGGNSVIQGKVIAVTQEELQKIDAYETSAYRRELVTLQSGKEAWVYKK